MPLSLCIDSLEIPKVQNQLKNIAFHAIFDANLDANMTINFNNFAKNCHFDAKCLERNASSLQVELKCIHFAPNDLSIKRRKW